MKETALALALSTLSFMLAIIWGSPLLRVLRHFHVGKMIRVEGPERHISKMGTPTMGGVMIILPVVLLTVLLNAASLIGVTVLGRSVLLPMLVLITYGSLGALVGFLTWIWLSVVILIVGAELEDAVAFNSSGTRMPIKNARSMQNLLNALGVERRALVVTGAHVPEVTRSARNIDIAKALPAQNLNVVDLINAHRLVMSEDAIRACESLWGGANLKPQRGRAKEAVV